MTEVMEANNTYVAAFERLERELAASGTPALHRLRKAAIARFAEMGFPGPRDEEWRFTPVSSLTRTVFEPVPEDNTFVGSAGSPTGEQSLPPGVILCRLAEALEDFRAFFQIAKLKAAAGGIRGQLLQLLQLRGRGRQ